MHYTNILSLICDSDTQTTVDYRFLYENMPISLFVNPDNIQDEPLVKKVDNGSFVVLYKQPHNIVLEYLFGGKNSIKSCTGKVKLNFVDNVNYKVKHKLHSDSKTFGSTIDQLKRQLLMTATVYSLKRDTVDLSQVDEKEIYKITYYLRKINRNNFFLESRVSKNVSPRLYPNIEDIAFTTVHKIDNKYQKLLSQNNETNNDFKL